MYNRLKTLYHSGKLSEEQLTAAVKKGWITEAQRIKIIQDK